MAKGYLRNVLNEEYVNGGKQIIRFKPNTFIFLSKSSGSWRTFKVKSKGADYVNDPEQLNELLYEPNWMILKAVRAPEGMNIWEDSKGNFLIQLAK